jgi:hypothetical protein
MRLTQVSAIPDVQPVSTGRRCIHAGSPVEIIRQLLSAIRPDLSLFPMTTRNRAKDPSTTRRKR